MGRFLRKRIFVKGELVTKSALHVGGNESELFADMMLATNGNGQFYIPATSLAGPMRAWWEQAFELDSKNNLAWGPNQKEKDKNAASFIRIDDAVIKDGNYSEIRDSVGIDRYTGAAADGIKFDREVVPEGTVFIFRMSLEVPWNDTDQKGGIETEKQLASLLLALCNGRIRFGAAKTRGLGKLQLKEHPEFLIEDFSDKDSFLNGLANRKLTKDTTFSKLLNDSTTVEPANILDIKVAWKSVLPVMVKDGRTGFNIDMIPLTTGRGNSVKMVLPGAGSKGVLRSHSERIIRTLMNNPIASPADRHKDGHTFDDQMVPHEIINRLFGAKGKRGENEYGISAVSVADCYPEDGDIDAETRKKLLTERAEENKKKLTDVAGLLRQSSGFCPVQHVAIDRWTGGAAESALYSVLEPGLTRGVFEISVDLNRIKGKTDTEKQTALALLILTLRDFKAGQLPVGFGGNRGLGAIEVETVNFSLKNPRNWPDLNGELGDLSTTQLQEAWNEFISSLAKERDAA